MWTRVKRVVVITLHSTFSFINLNFPTLSHLKEEKRRNLLIRHKWCTRFIQHIMQTVMLIHHFHTIKQRTEKRSALRCARIPWNKFESIFISLSSTSTDTISNTPLTGNTLRKSEDDPRFQTVYGLASSAWKFGTPKKTHTLNSGYPAHYINVAICLITRIYSNVTYASINKKLNLQDVQKLLNLRAASMKSHYTAAT